MSLPSLSLRSRTLGPSHGWGSPRRWVPATWLVRIWANRRSQAPRNESQLNCAQFKCPANQKINSFSEVWVLPRSHTAFCFVKWSSRFWVSSDFYCFPGWPSLDCKPALTSIRPWCFVQTVGEEVSVSLGAPQLGGCKLDAALSPLGGVCVERKTRWKKLNQDLSGQHRDLAMPEAATYPVFFSFMYQYNFYYA